MYDYYLGGDNWYPADQEAAEKVRAEIERFFDGTELIEPGLTSTHRWRPDGESGITDADAFFYAGIGRKP
jgi:hypothetical protein